MSTEWRQRIKVRKEERRERRKCEGWREGRKRKKERQKEREKEEGRKRNPQQRSQSLGHMNADILSPVHHPWLCPAHRGRLASVTTRIG